MQKTIKICFRFIFPTIGWIALIFGLIIWLMPPIFPWKYEELRRVVSPSGNYELVVTRANAGAMTRYRYGIFIVPKGAPFNPKQALFDSENLSPTAVGWTGNNDITIIHPTNSVYFYKPLFKMTTNNGPVNFKIHLNIEYPKTTP